MNTGNLMLLRDLTRSVLEAVAFPLGEVLDAVPARQRTLGAPRLEPLDRQRIQWELKHVLQSSQAIGVSEIAVVGRTSEEDVEHLSGDSPVTDAGWHAASHRRRLGIQKIGEAGWITGSEIVQINLAKQLSECGDQTGAPLTTHGRRANAGVRHPLMHLSDQFVCTHGITFNPSKAVGSSSTTQNAKPASFPPRSGRPTGGEPQRFLAAKDQPRHRAVTDLVQLVPPHIATSEVGLPRLAVVREDPLLAKGIGEVAKVNIGIIVHDDRRIATRHRMVISDAQQRLGHVSILDVLFNRNRRPWNRDYLETRLLIQPFA